MFKKFLTLILTTSLLQASSYTLFIASSKYSDVIDNYYKDIEKLLPNENIIVRTHEKPYYSLIINQINTIEDAKKIQSFLKENSTFKDSYIKKFQTEPYYKIVKTNKIEEKITIVKKVEPKKEEIIQKDYNHDVENSNDYITASTMYNVKEYKKSYDKFYKLFLQYNDNLNINYFLALSAMKVGLYDEATAAFERVLIKKPDFNQARLIYAKLLYDLKLKNESKKEFEILDKADITPESKKLVKNYLKEINIKPKKDFYNSSILVGVGRSSNVNNGLNDTEYRLPGLNDVTVSGENPIADNFHNEMFSFNILNLRDDYSLRNSFLVFNKNFFNEKDENTTIFSYKPSISFTNTDKNLLYTLGLGATRVKKENNQSIDTFNISANLTTKLILLSLNYQRFLYVSDNNKEKNFNKYDLMFKYNILNQLGIYTKLSNNSRIYNTRTDIDKNTYLVGLDYTYILNNKNMLKFNSEFSISNYKYYNDLFQSKREDKNLFMNLSYVNKFMKNNQIIFSTSYTKNNSNQDAYTYDEIEGKINYMKSFSF